MNIKKIITVLVLLFTVANIYGQTKINSPKCTVLSGRAEGVSLLFDGNTETGWFPGWDASKYPVKVQFDFGEPVTITKVRIFDAVGRPTAGFMQSNGSTNTLMASVELNLYLTWQEREVSTGIKTRYVILTISDIQGDIPIREIEFYGGKDIIVPPSPIPVVIKNLTGDAKKLGMNGFHWIPNDLLIFSNIRIYQMSQWTWTPSGMMVEPSFQANANYDSYFSNLKNMGVTAIPCINTIPDWMSSDASLRMCYPQFSGNSPQDYINVAQYIWQYVARYGSKAYPSDLIKINQSPRWNGDIINEKKSGLNLLKYVEFENEPDRPWNDDLHKYSPEQMAAFMSAIWDGHEKRMGMYVGVKNADPNVKVVLPGLAEINTQYLDRMRKWFNTNRTDKRFCADVIQVHHYSNSSNPKWPSHSVNLVNGRGVSPEEDQLSNRLKDLYQYTKQNLPKGTEVWFGEFGYDTQLSTNPWICQYPKLYGSHSAEELQSWWLQRIFLIGLSSGMDKMFLYNGIDETNAASGNLFASCGIMYGQVPTVGTSFGKKPSYKALQTLVGNLDGFTFVSDKSVSGVTILLFKKGLSTRYFYWSPTSNDTAVIFTIGKQILTAREFPQVFTPKIIDNKAVGDITTAVSVN